MKATGVIRILASREAYPEYPPPVLTVEKEDGKGDMEVVPSRNGEGYFYVIPFTEDNIKVAKNFWLRRGCKVEVDAKLPEHPFTEEAYDEWAEQDGKEASETAKKLVKAEEALLKAQSEFDAVKEEYQKQEAAYVLLKEDARASKKAIPEEPVGYTEALERVTKASKKLSAAEKVVQKLKGL